MRPATELRSAPPPLRADPPALRVRMPMTARRHLDATLRTKSASERLPSPMMRRARRPEIVKVEREIRPLRPRLDVVDMEDAKTLASEEASDGAALTVADERAIPSGEPLGRGEKAIGVHAASSRIMPAQT